MEHPKLRTIDAFPIQTSGQQAMCLRDPFNTKNTFVVPNHVFYIICHFDGNHSILDIQSKFSQKYGKLLSGDNIQQIIQELDKNLLLENDRSRDFIEKLKGDFINSTIRKDAHAGTAYEADKERLTGQIDKFFTSTDGPGKPSSSNKTTDLKGIIAPHIDVGCGGPCFAWAYKEIAESSDAELFIILGIAHTETKNLFVLTDKTFETPFGNVATDKDFLASLHKKNKTDYFEDEFIHKDEHSVGFQLIFLQYLYHRKKVFSIIPILCSSFGEAGRDNNSPGGISQFEEFVSSLKETIKESRKKICIIASVDLAHVGSRFGDRELQDEAYLKKLHSEDTDMLRYVENLDTEGFNNSIQKDNNSRKICGYPAIHTMLNVIEASKGKLLKYSQYTDQTNSTVSFASMAFYLNI
ncbi:MAG: AmmeMemoRadiSam system protein B [Planctomycetes bacterium RIFCSPLOWO2_12_FULL_40_19]|nr:MAG: AmmeMemoRadiSam system protein B [Planctomycetes bacterium RIFCSPLOWO2_12_FULL_40_19]